MPPDAFRRRSQSFGALPDAQLVGTLPGDQTPSAEPWRTLQKNLLALLANPPPDLWIEVWRLFLEDGWYMAELAKHAHSIIRAARAPPDWAEELIQEAVLYLAIELQKRPDMGLDNEAFGEKFPSRMGTMAHNDCRQALKRMRRLYGMNPDAVRQRLLRQDERIEPSLDLHEAIGELPKPEITVLRLYCVKYNIGQIAEHLGLSYWETWRAFWNAIKRIREDLD